MPFITVLFMANNMLPLFLPPGWVPDRFCAPLVGIALFAAAYMAEEVRGGLQSLDKGQYEGAMALGLGYWRMMRPRRAAAGAALVIPGIVNNFIGLFKDTTLVAIVGMIDFLAAMDNAFEGYDLERADDPADRLRLRGAVLFRVLLCDVALFGGDGAPPAPSGEGAEGDRPIGGRSTTRSSSSTCTNGSARSTCCATSTSTVAARRAHRGLRPVRLGQVDADPLHQPARGASARRRSASTASS